MVGIRIETEIVIVTETGRGIKTEIERGIEIGREIMIRRILIARNRGVRLRFRIHVGFQARGFRDGLVLGVIRIFPVMECASEGMEGMGMIVMGMVEAGREIESGIGSGIERGRGREGMWRLSW